MKFRTIINRLNWQQILIHLLAIWLFSAAFETFFYLSDPHFLEKIVNAKQQGLDISDIIKEDKTFAFGDFYYYSAVGLFTGFLIGFIISLAISIRGKGFWLNSLLSAISFFLLNRLGLDSSYFLKSIFLFPGIIIQKNIVLTIIINAFILLGLGILAFFLNKFNNPLIRHKTSVV